MNFGVGERGPEVWRSIVPWVGVGSLSVWWEMRKGRKICRGLEG